MTWRRRIEARITGLIGHLRQDAGLLEEQRHLNMGTPERVYWHYGYLMGLRDTLNLDDTASQRLRSEDKTNLYH